MLWHPLQKVLSVFSGLGLSHQSPNSCHFTAICHKVIINATIYGFSAIKALISFKSNKKL
jgi:hypothetical protein